MAANSEFAERRETGLGFSAKNHRLGVREAASWAMPLAPMSAPLTIGRGAQAAGWFNTHAKRVTPHRLQLFREALPEARVFTASTLREADEHAKTIAQNPPHILFCGGGDGTIAVMLNALRNQGLAKFPIIGLFRLGTGNGWPAAVGARRYERQLRMLSHVPVSPPTKHFQLCEIEGRLCQFAGVGWDATLLNDYRRNLENRQRQLLAGNMAAALNKGLGGYLYSLFRFTVPEELLRSRNGRTRLRLENIGESAQTWNSHRQRVQVPATQTVLYDGPMSIGAVGVEPYWGAGFKAFPYATAVPGRMNFRVYDRHVLVGVNNMLKLWMGKQLPGMHDWWITRVRLYLSRPMPFQMGGDVIGTRESIDFNMAKETVDLVDWAALERIEHPHNPHPPL